MQFIYYYKTSDGVRHEAEIGATTRDEAFAALRRQGIRPIRMLEKNPVKAVHWSNRWNWILIGMIALGAILFCYMWSRNTESPVKHSSVLNHSRYSSSMRKDFNKLYLKAEEIRKQYEKSMVGLELGLLDNYELIFRSDDLSALYEEINKGRSIVVWAREQAQELFRNVYTLFPASCKEERLDAQRLYGDLMSFLDAEEGKLDCGEYVLLLLERNREKWSVVHGVLEFTDVKLREEFNFLREEADESTVRWRRDFGGIETVPVQIPVSSESNKVGKVSK